MSAIVQLAKYAQAASRRTALLKTSKKQLLLREIASHISRNAAAILAANKKDIDRAIRGGLSAALIDRLTLTEKSLSSIVAGVRAVARLPDPVGQILEKRLMPSGLFLRRVRVPLGVIAMIYEARPNVTADAGALALFSGNAVLLKGGSDALESNKILVKIVRSVAKKYGVENAVSLLAMRAHEELRELLRLNGLVDVIIPRGSKRLIEFVRQHATVPVIETGASVVHCYIDKDADMEKAAEISLNSKLRRVSICNTLDTLLVDARIADRFLPLLIARLNSQRYGAASLEVRADGASLKIMKKCSRPKNCELVLRAAQKSDFDTEFLDHVLAVKIVHGVDEALEHIRAHSLKHTESIVTENTKTAEKFLREADAACVYWNASTQFSDGGEFGLGSEIGISTQKLHARGPFALEALTSYKWIGIGEKPITIRP